MDRVPYRRVTPPRNGAVANVRTIAHGSNRETSDVITTGETIVVQFIISGVLMLAVLLICLVDVAPMVTLRGGLRQVLAGATTVDEIITDMRQLGLFLQEPPAEEQQPLPLQHIYTPQLQPPPTTPLTAYEEEASNPQSPGSSATPGLWE